MRELIINKIKTMLLESSNSKFSARYNSVCVNMFKHQNGIDAMTNESPELTKKQKADFRDWDILTFDYSKLGDEQLLQMFEIVLRRYYTQM